MLTGPPEAFLLSNKGNPMIRRSMLSGSALAAIILLSTPAHAQADDVRPADETAAPQGGPAYDGDIVVTARRRAERAQDVPIAMSVVGEQELARTGAFNLNRLQQQQPTLQFYSSNPRNSAINIRGLGAPFGLTNDGLEQGVGFYLDGVYVGRVGASTFDFVDIERVEVLRGPQGTLYGKNTTAGAVNITTRPPSFEFEGRAEASVGNYDFLQFKGSVSGPLVADKLAVRLSTSLTHRSGTIYNVRTDEDLHRLDNATIRGQLLWRATDTLDVTLFGDFNVQNPMCCVQYYAREGATQRPLNRQYAALAAAFGYAPPSKDPFDRVTDLDAELNSRQEMGGVSLVANWDVGFATLTSVTAWRYWDWGPANDRDFIGLPITTVSQNPSQQKQFTQELRLASNGSGRLQYTLGAFYFTQSIDTQGSQVQGPAASRWLLNPGASVIPGDSGCATPTTAACDPSVLDGLTSTNVIGFDNQSFAIFGKLNWEPVDGLHIQPGLRLNYDKKSGNYLAIVTTGTGSTELTADQRGVLAPQSYAPHFSEWNISGDITTSYDVARDVMVYATYARSFKSGGINLSGLPLDSSNNPILSVATVKPEEVNHYEIGLKSQFLDRRLTLNLAAFQTEVKDYQATVTNGQLGVIRGYLANAGKVRVRGIELDSNLRLSDRLRVNFNGTFLDGKYVDFKDAPCPPELSGGSASPPFCDISGQRLPGISRYTLTWGGEYNIPVGSGEVYAGYDASFRSRFSSNPSPSLYTWVSGYALHNFRLGYRTGDNLNVFAWVRNAFDQNYFELLSAQSGSTGLIIGQPGDPRTFGVTVSKSF